MAWTNSKVFTALLESLAENLAAFDLDSDTLKIALFDNDVTPSQTAVAASTAYNTGAWAIAGNEVSDGTEWDAGGEPITGISSSIVSTTYVLDGTDTPSGGTSATLVNAFGGFVYDDTLTTPVADQGLCYLYFGGAQTVTDGQFTVIYHANGVMSIAA